jgi:hypothetical protein
MTRCSFQQYIDIKNPVFLASFLFHIEKTSAEISVSSTKIVDTIFHVLHLLLTATLPKDFVNKVTSPNLSMHI